MIVAMGRPMQETGASLDMRRKQNAFDSFLFLLFLGGWARSRSAAIANTHVVVIDAAGAPPRRDSTVVVTALDGAGNSFIPRLADMHVHLNGACEPTGSRGFVEDIRNTEKSALLL